MGLFDSVAGWLGLPNRGSNEFRDVDRGSFDMPGYGQRGDRLLGMAGQVGGRGLPNMDGAAQGQVRGQQQDLIGMLRQQAAGQGPSIAEQQLRRSTDRAIAQQQGLAATAGPTNQALAARMAAQQGGALQSAMSGQAADARMQEQLNAQQQLGGLLGGVRGQDIGMAQAQAQLGLQGQQLNDQTLLELLRQEQANAEAQQRGGFAYEQQRGQRFGGLLSTPSPGEQLLGGLSTLGAGWASRGR